MSEPTVTPCRRCGTERRWMASKWQCPRCKNEYQRARRASRTPEQRAAEKVRERATAAIRRANRTPEQREHDRAVVQAWRDADPERHRAGARDWYARNAEYARAAKLAEYYANPEQFYARNLVRKARINDAVCVHGPKCVDANDLKALYGLACIYCGNPAEAADHFYPLARGGLHCVDNLVPACGSCNSRKSARDPYVWLAELAASS